MIWNSISIKKTQENDCEFFKKFKVKYSIVMLGSLMKSMLFDQVKQEELEIYIKTKEKNSRIEMEEIKHLFLAIGFEIESPVFEEEREFSLKDIYTEQFKDKNILEIFEIISNIEEFLSLFIIVEDILIEFLNSKEKNTTKSYKIIENVINLLEKENKEVVFLKEMKNRTYLKDLKDLEKIWQLLRKIRNLIAHSYGNMTKKNIKVVDEMIRKIISILDTPTLMILSNMNSLLNPCQGIPESEDIINRPVLKEFDIITLDSITCRFFRNFFVYFMESLNESFKN